MKKYSGKPSEQTCSVCGERGHNKNSHKEPLTEKKCSRCQEFFLLEHFHSRKKSNQKPLHYSHLCRRCGSITGRESIERTLESKVRGLFSAIKSRSKRKGWDLSLTLDDIHDQIKKQNGLCFYTGELLSFKNGRGCMSVDRLDSSIGYTKENIVITSWEINDLRGNFEITNFLDLCRKISDYSREKEVDDPI